MTKLASSKVYPERWGVTGDSGTEYVVSRKPDGSWGCSCPRWKFHPAPKVDCKHITRTRWEIEPGSVGVKYIPKTARIIEPVRQKQDSAELLLQFAEAVRRVTEAGRRMGLLVDVSTRPIGVEQPVARTVPAEFSGLRLRKFRFDEE